jgi:hypothetical protein
MPDQLQRANNNLSKLLTRWTTSKWPKWAPTGGLFTNYPSYNNDIRICFAKCGVATSKEEEKTRRKCVK